MKILHITASYKPAYIYGGPIYSVSALCETLIKSEVRSPKSEVDGKTEGLRKDSEDGRQKAEVVDGKSEIGSWESEDRSPKTEVREKKQELRKESEDGRQKAEMSSKDLAVESRESMDNESPKSEGGSQKSNIKVTVYTTLANGKEELTYPNGAIEMVDGVEVQYFKRITKDHSHFSPSLLWNLWKTARQFDVIHIHAWWNLVSMGAVLICLMKGIKPIVSPRGMLGDYTFSRGKKIFHLLFGKYFLSKCDFHATTSMEADEIVKRVFGDQEKVNVVDLMVGDLEERGKMKEKSFIFIIHNIVKVPTSLPVRDRVYDGTLKLIFLSRIHHKKGIELLLEALALVNFPFQLSIVGEGKIEYVESLKLKVKNLGIEDCMNWVGAVYGDEKFKLLAENDLFVLPSYNENFANVVIEAIAVQTPVFISNKVGLSKFVLKNKLGIVCQLNTNDIGDKLKVYFDQMQHHKAIKINNFNISNTKDFYRDLYERIY